VMGINVQVCWEKFANYWDVEMRLVPMEGDRFHLSAEEAVKLCDENTIGVVAILGSTFDGSYEPVQAICAALDDLQARTGLDVPVHVDGASGGFVAPFADPDLVWDFRLPRVASINASGHKYGLVYPGVGWVVWRDAEALPEELIFWVNYLGDNMPTFALNFSRPGAQVVAQYYNFLRLGFDGYRKVQLYSRAVAMRLADNSATIAAAYCFGFHDVVRLTGAVISLRSLGGFGFRRMALVRLTHRRHARECGRKLRTVVRKLGQPEPLLVFIIYVHRHDRDFITRRKFRQLIFHRFQDLGTFEKTTGAVFTQIENQNQGEWLASLAFAREVRDVARLAVVEHLKVLSAQIRDREIRLLVFHERIQKHDARLDLDGVFNFLRMNRERSKRRQDEK